MFKEEIVSFSLGFTFLNEICSVLKNTKEIKNLLFR